MASSSLSGLQAYSVSIFMNFRFTQASAPLQRFPSFAKPLLTNLFAIFDSFLRWAFLMQVTRGLEKTLMTSEMSLQIGRAITNNYNQINITAMKRTKETYFRNFPTEAETNLMSGCREFEGEDLKYDARREFFKNKQKQWLDEQMEEKRQRQNQEKFENNLYDMQTQELNRMRGMLEDNFDKTKTGIKQSTTQTNQQLDLERKDRERAEKEARLKYEKEEAEYLKQRGAKQDFYMDVK